MKGKLNIIFFITLFSGLIFHIISLVLGKTILHDWKWVHDPVHSSVEICGSFIAFLVAHMLLTQEKLGKGTKYNVIIASALIGMGIFDGVHALFHAGNHFVLFHSLATFWGGLLFSLIWFSSLINKYLKDKIVWVTSAVTTAFVILFIVVPKLAPQMVENGSFTNSAIFLNICGGILLILASLKLYMTYLKSKKIDDVLFAMHCLLFGLAATMFQESKLWDFPWWSWHFLRFMAYGAALYFSFVSQKEIEKDLLEISIKKKTKPLLDRIQFILESAEIGVWEFDVKKDSLKWDDQMYRLYDIKKEDFKSNFSAWHDLLDPEERDEVIKEYQNALKSKDSFESLLKIKTPVGEEKYLRVKAVFTKDENKETVHVIGVNWDITTETLAHEKIETFLNILKVQNEALNHSAIVAETNTKGEITFVNDKFCEVSKYSKGELTGQNHRILKSGHHSESFYLDLWKTISQGNIWHGEIKNKAKDGSYYWVDSTIYPHKNMNGKIEKYIAIRFEITDRKNLELQLLDAKNSAEKASEAKASFLANMSHEIRTPLHGILSSIELMKEHSKSTEVKELIRLIESSGETLSSIINDILDFSKIEAGKIELEEIHFDLSRAIKDVIGLLTNKLNADQKIHFDVNEGVPDLVGGDKNRFKQIMTNLVGNAVKFTDKNIWIYLSSQSKPEGKIDIKVSVKDDGIGIPVEKQHKLFDSFSQTDSSTTRKFGGTGLGLAICKGIVEEMGGEIKVRSQKGKGAEFTFTITVREVESNIKEIASEIEPKSSTFEHNCISILMAEDNRTNQIIGKKVLKKLGFDIDIAENGLVVLEKIKEKNYDLILMDQHMPEMDGVEATKEIISSVDKINRPRIVALSASSFKEDRERCITAGMENFLSKPLELNLLKEEIEKTIHKKSFQIKK